MIPTPSEVMARTREYDQRWQRGRQLFTALRDLAPHLAGKLAGTDADCTFSDNRIATFWMKLAEARRET